MAGPRSPSRCCSTESRPPTNHPRLGTGDPRLGTRDPSACLGRRFQESVFVGLGAAHGMKFAPTFGRLLADLATTGSTNADIGAFAFDRPALTRPDAHVHWLV
jgi:glycine/D-amino acid oxidase-like deaminating enzyme